MSTNKTNKTMNKIFISMVILALISGCMINSKNSGKKNMVVMFYNTENLFDTINDLSNAGDDEFLPNTEKQWNTQKYLKKLNDIARVITSVQPNNYPQFIGMAELENSNVLSDLISLTDLKNAGYEIIHRQSNDYRGIDVGLLYKKDNFKHISTQYYTIKFSEDTTYTTREILYCKGIFNKKDTLHIFVNHWPSRSSGQDETEKKRVKVAQVLRSKVDSVFMQNAKANIIIMGDLNDEPDNLSIQNTLLASDTIKMPNELLNLMYKLDKLGKGTYNFKGNWNMLDHLIISKNLTNPSNKLHVNELGGQIVMKDFMIYTDAKTNQISPNKTYGGKKYYGGISDHFPVYAIFNY